MSNKEYVELCANCGMPQTECRCPKNQPKVAIEIRRSEEIETLRQELENVKTEKAELESTLETIANKEFKAKCQKYGLNPETTSIEELKATIEATIPKPPENSETTPFNEAQILGRTPKQTESIDKNLRSKYPLSMQEFDSYEEALSELNKMANDTNNPNQKEAQAKLNELIQRHKEAGSKEFELEGSIKDLQKGYKLRMKRIK